jgi:flagellar hook-basal body complex protein FliE
VDRAQHESTRSARAVELGESGASLAQAMLAAQEARVGLKAVVEVRNRLVQAYQDVLNMPL